MTDEGWLISYASGLDIPTKFNVPYSNRIGNFWQVQRNDDDDILEDDLKAEKLAKKNGLMIDDYGVVIGYNGISYLEHPEELDFYKNIQKYNL